MTTADRRRIGQPEAAVLWPSPLADRRLRPPGPGASAGTGWIGPAVSALLHGSVLAVLLLPRAVPDAPPPAATAQIELIRQDTSTGGGDRYVQGEGDPDATTAQPAPPPAPTAPSTPVPAAPRLADAAPIPVPMPGAPAPVPMPPSSSRPAPVAPHATEVNLGEAAANAALGEAGTGRVLDNPAVIPAAINAQVRNAPPAYPRDAARRGEQGTVGLRIHILPDGSAAGVVVVSTSGSARLDAAARAAAARWHFHPALRGGQPVASDLLFRFDFVLNGGTDR